MERLKRLNYRAAILGPEGSGKTTLLEDLQAPLHAMGWKTHLYRFDDLTEPAHWRALLKELPRLSSGDLVLLDGAEQLGRLKWHRLRRLAAPLGGLIITVHRSGRLPALIHCRTDDHLLLEIIEKLLGDRPPGGLELARELHARHSGNLRHALREMYDRWAWNRMKISDKYYPGTPSGKVRTVGGEDSSGDT